MVLIVVLLVEADTSTLLVDRDTSTFELLEMGGTSKVLEEVGISMFLGGARQKELVLSQHLRLALTLELE